MDENEQVKEVYSQFGLAIYLAQVVEYAIVNLFIAFRLKDRHKIIQKDVDSIFSDKFKKTMGMLIKELKKEYEDNTLDIELEKTLQLRNELCHSYFRRRVVAFSTIEGREKMINELKKYSDFFIEMDDKLSKIFMDIASRYGMTEEMIEKSMDDVLKEGDSARWYY